MALRPEVFSFVSISVNASILDNSADAFSTTLRRGH
jgi:hypothetical protein